MSDAPERIWADGNAEWDSGSWGLDKEFDNDVEYVRADRIEELERKIAKAVASLETLEDASKVFGSDTQTDRESLRYAHECTRRLCKATLAELKGEPS